MGQVAGPAEQCRSTMVPMALLMSAATAQVAADLGMAETAAVAMIRLRSPESRAYRATGPIRPLPTAAAVAPVRLAAVAARTTTVVAAEEAASAVAVAAPVAVVPGQAVRMRRQFQ